MGEQACLRRLEQVLGKRKLSEYEDDLEAQQRNSHAFTPSRGWVSESNQQQHFNILQSLDTNPNIPISNNKTTLSFFHPNVSNSFKDFLSKSSHFNAERASSESEKKTTAALLRLVKELTVKNKALERRMVNMEQKLEVATRESGKRVKEHSFF